MFVETYLRAESIDDELIDAYVRLGYRAVFVEGIDVPTRYSASRKLLMLRRATFTRDELRPSLRNSKQRGVLISLLVNDVDDLRAYVRFRDVIDIVTLGPQALIRLGSKAREKLTRLNVPVEICVSDLLDTLKKGKFMRGFHGVIQEYINGRLDLIVSPCARSIYEVMHPMISASVLITLDVPEVLAYRAITLMPRKLVIKKMSDKSSLSSVSH